MTHLEDSILSLDTSLDARLRDLHIQILALDIARDGRRDVDISDSLSPFVRKPALLCQLLCFDLLVELLALRGRWRRCSVRHCCGGCCSGL